MAQKNPVAIFDRVIALPFWDEGTLRFAGESPPLARVYATNEVETEALDET
jgi:hypothetical protein